MSKYIVAPIAAGIMLAVAGTAQAVTKQTTFQVSATVTTNCVIGANNMLLGAFDGTNDLASTSDITVRCTNGTPYNVHLSTGSSTSFAARRLTNATTDYLVYNLYTDGSYGTVWGDTTGDSGRPAARTGAGMGTEQTWTVYGRLLASDNQRPIDVGSYSDTITATVVY